MQNLTVSLKIYRKYDSRNKEKWKQVMLRNIAPKRLWELCLMYVMDTYFLMSHPIYTLDGRNIYEILTRDTPDISEFIEHY